jgi:PAS domain S-box-containing protein
MSKASASNEIPREPPGGLDARFCEVMDAAPVMIWVSGQDKLCVWFNRLWLAFTGRRMAQELGNGWAEGVHRDDFDRCLDIYISHFDARKDFRMQYRLRRYDGAYHWIDDTGIPRYARDGTFLGYIGSCIDIHEHRETQAELRLRLMEIAQLNRRADAAAVAASIAHQLNQPLAAILSNTEAAELCLAAEPPRLAAVAEILADIRRDDHRAAEAIARLRQLIAENASELRRVDLNEVVRGAREILAVQAAEMDVDLTVIEKQRELPVLVDSVQLQQVVLNLAWNGFDAMLSSTLGNRRMVLQTAMGDESTVELSVSDTGGGIPSDKLDEIFKTFYTTKKRGTGIGLSIARTIVEAYGGRIWAENRPEGGVVLRFTLPLAETRSPSRH